MIKVFSAQDFIEVAFWRNYLEQQDISCQIRNEFLGSAVGEVPAIECWPELWIINDNDEAEAYKYLASEPLAEQSLPAWQCVCCGEQSEGQFTDCWNCGESKNEQD
ncbi:MAG: DUF2007 domain-containing protein [Cycloclasticus sp.]|nr:hypothetical protein A9Q80_07255 [Cycloclasticus sp. 46_83_sub15_T18]OUR82206.1 hypothetical protein A9Q82_07645 [Cycloclasticus sp. 46_120_T64]